MRTHGTNDNKASDGTNGQSIDRDAIERLANSDLPCAWAADLMLDVIDDVNADDGDRNGNRGDARR